MPDGSIYLKGVGQVFLLLKHYSMFKQKMLLITLFSFLWTVSYSQQMRYTAEESYLIHDSINKSRWDIGGRLSHYSFRYMSEFFPVAIIEKPDRFSGMPERPLKAIEEIRIKHGKDSVSFDEYLEKLHINSFIIVHKGNIVYEKYLSMQPNELHSLQSCTKVITATLITQLINEGKIEINKPVENYIPELNNSEWKGTTIKDLLNMRSGMKGSETSDNMGGFTNPKHLYYSFEEALGILPKVDSVVNSVYDYIATLKRSVPAGTQAEYNSMNTFILGWIAEKITGKKYSDLVSEKIWKPMGASSDAYVCISDKGIPWTHGGISATLRDFARFGMLYTKSDIVKNKEKNIRFAQLKEIFETPQLDLGFEKFQWGYQWDMARDGVLMKGGFGGQSIIIDPERDLVIAYFNHIDKNWMKINMISWKAFNEIKNVVDSKKN